MADISINIACKELKIAQIAQLNQLFQLLHLVKSYVYEEKCKQWRQQRFAYWIELNLGTVLGTLSQIWLLAKKDSLERKTRDMLDKHVVFDQDYGKVSYHPSFPSPQECL